MISMCGLAGVWGPAEGSVVSGVWAPAGASVNSASGRPSDNPSATRSHVLIGFPPCGVRPSSNRIEGRCAPPARPNHTMRTGAAVALRDFDPPDVALSHLLPKTLAAMFVRFTLSSCRLSSGDAERHPLAKHIARHRVLFLRAEASIMSSYRFCFATIEASGSHRR